MTPLEALERLLRSYTQYYDMNPEPPAPFQAAAEFHSHGESYLLIKSAKLWEMDSNEYVYFAVQERFSAEELSARIEAGWDHAMPQIHPGENHRNSDVTVIFLAESLSDDAQKLLRRTHCSKGYRHGLEGWSNLRLGAIELSSGRVTVNRHGRDLKKLLGNILKS